MKDKYILIVIITMIVIGMLSKVEADSSPPYLTSPIPPKGAQGVQRQPLIVVMVSDDETGVDPMSLSFIISDEEVEPIIEPSENGYRLIYKPETELPAGSKIVVRVEAFDYAGNFMDESWYFWTEDKASSGRGKMSLISPQNGQWLSFVKHRGRAIFSWQDLDDSLNYLLKFSSEGIGEVMIELTPEDITKAFSIASYSIPLSSFEWLELSNLGEFEWTVAGIDPNSKKIIIDFAEPNKVTFASPLSVVLKSPLDLAILTNNTPPIFKWEIYPLAKGYVFGMVKLDSEGNFTDEYYIAELPLFINELPVSQVTWQSLSPGEYVWTVIAKLKNKQYSDYILYRFTKEE